MSERFFVAAPIAGDSAELVGDEARHLTAVMRAAVGDEVVLFDGSGGEFLARVTAISKRAVELAIALRREPARELPQPLTLAVALPKGDRQKWLIEKATELGVTCLVPLVTERGVALPVESALDRLRRSVVEACKQCGRNRLLEIASPANAADYFRQVPANAERWIADPVGVAVPAAAVLRPIFCAIGPEGGFTPAEVAAAFSAGWRAVSLGPRILRVETAAIALAAIAATKLERG
ncbi:MAG: 16S rRNA (uracil(1498)-N(3))-methyltransferase [Pirellulaceae bacterium]|nr:16S rRNA (uracil(1498)-N(3))-methyltransferase [Pirellulaceae bacterium]